MDSRKKACPNEECTTYKKQKFNPKINYCPECGTKLIYVCKSLKCYKPLDADNHDHVYCFECDTKRKDQRDKAIDLAKKGVSVVSAAVVVPFAKALEKDAGKMAQKAAHCLADTAAKIIKNK